MGNAVLAPDALARLIKLAGLLSSSHDGERAAAALKCTEFLRTQGLSWAEVLQPPPPPAPVIVQPPPVRTWRVVADEILINHYGALRQPNEVEFVTGLLQRGYAPTERQEKWLRDIARRCGVPEWDPRPNSNGSGTTWGTP